MAKAKQKELTIEEKLEQALLPEDEQPYEVPSNWVWTRAKICAHIFSGKSPKYVKESNTNIAIGQQANQDYGIDLQYIKYCSNEFFNSMPNEYFLRKNDVLLNTLGTGTIGRAGIFEYEDKRILTDGHLFVFRTHQTYLPKLIYYYLKMNQKNIIDDANGSTNQKFLSITKIADLSIPLPPLSEQQRIIDRIESLFAKLDNAKEMAQNAIGTFETRKSKMLEMAIKGEYTQKWRTNSTGLDAEKEIKDIKKNKKYKCDTNETVEFAIPNTWCWTRLGDLIELLTDYHANGSYEILKENVELIDTPDYACMIRTTNFEKNNFDSLMKYVSKHAYEFLSKSKLYGDEILINKIGNAGSVYFMPKLNRPASLAMNLFMLRMSEGVLPKYIYYHLNTVFSGNDIGQFVRGITTKSIDKKSINSIKIALPPFKEQQEIVRVLDILLEKEEKIQELCDVIDKIDLMKKSILARAFRGELGTNDLSEESSIGLLKEILAKV